MAGSGAVHPAPTHHAVGVDRAILSPISCRSQPRTSLRRPSNARSRSPLHILHAALALHHITTPSPAQLRQPPRRHPCRRPLPRRRPCSSSREGQSPLQHQGRASMFRELEFSTSKRQIRARTSSQKALKRGCICCMNGYEWSKDWDAYPTHQASKTWTSLCTSKPELCKQGKHPAGGAPAQGSAQGAPRTLAAGIGAEAALGGPSQRTIAASKITRRRAKNYQYQRQNRRKLCRAVSIPGRENGYQ